MQHNFIFALFYLLAREGPDRASPSRHSCFRWRSLNSSNLLLGIIAELVLRIKMLLPISVLGWSLVWLRLVGMVWSAMVQLIHHFHRGNTIEVGLLARFPITVPN